VSSTPRGKAALWLVAALLVLAGGAAAWTWSTLAWSYSEGERVGYVQKFSRKGYLCKTWEGELAMVTIPGTTPEKFFFSVRGDAVAAEVNRSLGKRVALKYQQHLGVPTSCFGETEYFVDDVLAVH
jgi:hypothetical protein